MSDDLTHRFTLDFGDGVTVSAVLDVEKLRKSRGKAQFCNVIWDGNRKESHKSLYRQWMLDVQQRAAELLPGKIMWVFQTEIYTLEPGKKPRRER